MNVQCDWLRKEVAALLVVILIAPALNAATTQNPQSTQPSQTSGQTAAPAEQPNNPASAVPSAPAPQTNAAPASAQQQPQQQTSQPVGTAAAPYQTPVGVAVSRPAGAAIAPAKQRRSHTFIIKMGLVIGAAVAVGTVVALSKGSPNRPGH